MGFEVPAALGAKLGRPDKVDVELLYRAQTHDPLWNACQESLRIHGEIHPESRVGAHFLRNNSEWLN